MKKEVNIDENVGWILKPSGDRLEQFGISAERKEKMLTKWVKALIKKKKECKIELNEGQNGMCVLST